MNLSKLKRWSALLKRVIVKQQAKSEQTYPAFTSMKRWRTLIYRMITK